MSRYASARTSLPPSPLSSPQRGQKSGQYGSVARRAKRATESDAEPAAPKEQHCLRCHRTFYDGLTTHDALNALCIVPHVFREDPIYLMGGDFTYASDCCGEFATVTERGAGTGHFEMSTTGAEPCFVGSHTVYPSDVKWNDVNVFKCVRGAAGRCVREVLVQREDEPVFLDWGSSEWSSGSEETHAMESEGSGVQSVHKIRCTRR